MASQAESIAHHDLSTIYTTTGDKPFEMGAELRCQEHPEWWSDADGTNLPDVIKAAQDHVREEHRVHVDGCKCRGNQVIDQRCIRTTGSKPPDTAPYSEKPEADRG